jgi:hypothetical protein
MCSLGFRKYLSPAKSITILLVVFIISFSCHEIISPITYGGDYSSQIVSEWGTGVVRSDGSLWNWFPASGSGYYATQSDTLTEFGNVNNVLSIDQYAGLYIAADEESNIWLWGQNTASNTIPQLVEEPIIIGKLSGITQVSMLGIDVNLLCSNGTVYSFTIDVTNPAKFLDATKISGMINIIKISESLALKNDGTVCEIKHTEPEFGGLTSGVKDAVDIENVWYRRTVILKRDSTVWAWGQNDYGQLGNGTYENSSTPVQVKDLTDIIDISANYDFNLALKSDGTVWFWGYVGKDQNTNNYRYSTPVKIEAIDNVAVIYAAYPCYFMKNDNTYWYYIPKSGEYGQLNFKGLN